MTNFKIRNITDSIFHWDIRRAITKKASYKLYDRLWIRQAQPPRQQMIVPINQTIYNVLQKEK